MVGSVHMDMEAAGAVDLCPRMPDLPHTLLKLGQFCIGELWRHHFNFIPSVVCMFIAIQRLTLTVDTAIAHQFPFFVFCVFNDPCIIGATFIPGHCSKIVRQRLRGLLAGDASHLYLDAEILVLHPSHAAASFRSSSSTARMRRPMASITVTVTLLPACL